MRRLLIIVWIVVGLAGLYGWSRSAKAWRALELAEREVREARLATAQRRWDDAEQRYESALALLPADAPSARADRCAVQVELLRARARNGKLFESVAELEQLVAADDGLMSDDARLRAELATQSLYAAWLMRRNGVPRSRWQPFVEASRQNLQFLSDRDGLSSTVLAAARANLDRVRAFEKASDVAMRDQAFPEPDLLNNRIPGESALQAAAAMPSRGTPPPSFGSPSDDGGGPPTNPPGGGW